jgi:hypothetical protein
VAVIVVKLGIKSREVMKVHKDLKSGQ